RVIALRPLLQPALQIAVGESSQARDGLEALRVGAVTDEAGRDIGVGEALLVEGPPRFDERAVAVIGGLGGKRCAIRREFARKLGTEPGRRAPHILLRDRIVAAVVLEGQKLFHDVVRLLSREPWRSGEALRRGAVAPCAVAHGQILLRPRRRGGADENRQKRYPCRLSSHGPRSALLACVEKRPAPLLSAIDPHLSVLR